MEEESCSYGRNAKCWAPQVVEVSNSEDFGVQVVQLRG